jgi:hypothetical protein
MSIIYSEVKIKVKMLKNDIKIQKVFGQDKLYEFELKNDSFSFNNLQIIAGKEYTYTWSKEDFYMVDKPSKIINMDYPLNSISVYKKINKYFSETSEGEKALLYEDEGHVVNFIASCIE